jgi:hypothetical protein
MPIQAQSSDGTIHEFPDDIKPEVMDSVMKKYATENQMPSESSGIKELGKGLARGVTGTLGSLGEAITGKGLREGLQIPENPKFTPHYADRMNKALGLEQQGDTLAGDVGEAVANPLNLLGGGSAALKIGGAAMGGAGSHYGRKIAEEFGAPEWGQTLASVAGGVAGGAGTGAVSKAMREAAGRKALAKAPDIEASAKQGYKVIENDPTLIPTHETDALHSTLDTWLDTNSRDDINSPMTYKYMERYLKDRTQPARYKDLMNLHAKLGTVPADERIAGQLARSEVVDFMKQRDPQINNTLKDAINDWNVKSQVEELQKVTEQGKNQAGVTGWGGNTQNAELQGLNRILKNDKRLSRLQPGEQQALEDVVKGTFMSRGSRFVDKAVPHALLPLLGMASFPVAVGLATAKTAFRELGKHLTDQQIKNLIAKVQERATINQQQAAKNAATRVDAKKSLRDQTLRSGAVGGQQALDHQGEGYDTLNAAQP